MDRAEKLKIFARCLGDPIYAIETFLKTYDLTQEGYVPFKLFHKQKDRIHCLRKMIALLHHNHCLRWLLLPVYS